MITILIQSVLLLLAGFALFCLWRASRSSDRLINNVIAGGFLARALVGQLMFWISYAHLGIGRSLQMGDGLWFFARDALEYFPMAVHLVNGGVRAIVDYPTGGASVAFVKVLATFVLLFGRATSVAVLLNLFCYLGMTAIIGRWSKEEPRAGLAAAFVICAISLSPAFFLWSLQPLKDTFFQFVVVMFVGACAAWQREWVSSRRRLRTLLLSSGAMTIALLAISAIRWYFAFALFFAAIIFLVITASISRARKAMAFAAALIVIVLLSRAFLIGGGPYIPKSIIRILKAPTAFAEAERAPSEIVLRAEMARDGFERAGGRTSIHAGGNLSRLDEMLGAPANGDEPPGAGRSRSSRRRVPVERPASFITHVLTGAVSVAVPRSIGERLGLFHIGGGQGMFWFTELDTVILDLILVVAMTVLVVGRAAALRNPLVWFLVLLTLFAGVPLAYAITNYGTLFRLREMIYIGLALIPLALMTSSRRDELGAETRVSPAS